MQTSDIKIYFLIHHMFLIFNWVSSEWYIWLYNDNREYVSHEFFEISW